VAIPEVLRFRVAFTRSIDTATAAVGDPIKAKLVTPIRDHATVLIPAGAEILARIVRLRQFYGRETSVSLGIRLETVDAGGSFVTLIATPDLGAAFPKSADGALQRRVPLGVLHGLEDRAADFEFRNVRLLYRLIGAWNPSG
jgi:hypothetical protein